MTTEQPETLRIADDLRHSIAHHGREDAFTLNAYEAEKRLRALHAEKETLIAGYNAARLEIASLQGQLEAVGAGGVGPLGGAPAQPAAPEDSAVFDFWRADHMPQSDKSEAWAEWCALRSTRLAPQQAAQAGWCDGCSPDNCGGCATSAAPVPAVQQDAERYRWLREYAIGAYITAQGKGSTAIYLLTKVPALDGIGEETDAAIDAARGAVPVDAQHSTACLYHYALSRLGLRDNIGLRVLFWDAHNSLSWDSKTDWYVTPDVDKADCGRCNAAIAAQQGDAA